jgi:zinc protease
MIKENRWWIEALLVISFSLSTGYPQTRQSPQAARRPAGSAGAPFLQQAKSYEESPYVTKVVFRNGLKVLVNEYKTQPIVSMQAYVRAGTLNEPAKSTGLTHLLSALITTRAADKSLGSLRQNVQSIGGRLATSADYQTTELEIIAPAAQWKRALNAQAEALLGFSFSQVDLNLSANILQAQARRILDDAQEFAREKLLELAFDQPRMGKWDTVANANLKDVPAAAVTSFYKAAYTPANTLLVISGDISASEVLNELAKIYSKSASSVQKPASIALQESQNGFRYRAIKGNVAIPRLLFGFHTTSERSADYPALEVLKAMLGVGDGSVLSARLRDQKKVILSQKTEQMTRPDFGYLTVQLDVLPADIDRSEIATLTEIELLKREAPTDAEMERALAQLERSYWSSLETVTGRARALERFELLGDWKRMDRYLSELRQVKRSDIRRVANKYLNLDNCTLLEVLPQSAEERNMTTEAVRRTFEGLLKPATDQEQAQREREVVPATKIPESTGTFKFSEIRYPFQMASVLRGPDIFIREDHTNPVIDMGFFFPGGRSGEKKENAGITRLMTHLMLRGTKDKPAAQFYRQFEIYGGRVRPVVADDYFGIRFSVLSKNFDPAFNLFQEMIKTPGFEKDLVDREKDLQKAEMLVQRNSESCAGQLVNQVLFKGSAYSLNVNGTEESLAAISLESLQGWYETYVKNRKPVVVSIGDTKGTSMASNFVQHFSGSRIQETKIQSEPVKPVEKGESIVTKWDQSGDLILIGFQAPAVDDEDRYAAAVIENYSGGLGKFSQELTERQGAALEISADYAPRLRGGSFVFSTTPAGASDETVLKALLEQIQQLTSATIMYRDFRAAVSEAVGHYWIRGQDRFLQIGDIVEDLLAGKGIDGYQNFASDLQQVKQEEFEDVAGRFLKTDKAVVVRMQRK